jgi:hypothetical protein
MLGPITATFSRMLIDTGWEKGLDAQSLQEIEEMCNGMRECLQSFDGFFSVFATKQLQYNEEKDLEQAKDYRDKAMHALRRIRSNVTTKVHTIEEHCLQIMELFGGVGDVDGFIKME